MSNKRTALQRHYESAKNSAASFRESLKEKYDLAYARLASKSNDARSHVREGSLSNLIFERACRNCAQQPTGQIDYLSPEDYGKSQLMNSIWNNYVLPNADSQYEGYVKTWMLDYYSLAVGSMPVLVFYRADDAYIGPDWRVLNPQFVYPQARRLSPHDCDYVFVDTYHSKQELIGYWERATGRKWGEDVSTNVSEDETPSRGSKKAKRAPEKKPSWDVEKLADLIRRIKNGGSDTTADETTNLQAERGEASGADGDQIMLTTKYSRGRGKSWITFDPDTGDILKTIENPLPSGRIPVVWKLAMPLIDSFYGMGDVERGSSLQKTIDSMVNLVMDSMKIRIYPPVRYSDNINLSQIPMRAGARWRLSRESDVSVFNYGSSVSQEFTTGYQFAKGALLNQNGTTDTTVSADQKFPGYGKSPEALKQLNERQNARDTFDRKALELALQEIYELMIEMMAVNSEKEGLPQIEFDIFGDEIQQLAEAGYLDVMKISDSAIDRYVDGQPVFSGTGSAHISVDPSKLVGKWRYTIDVGSTTATDDKEGYDRTMALIELVTGPAGQAITQDLAQEGKKFSLAAAFNDLIQYSGGKNRDQLIVDIPSDEAATANGDAGEADTTEVTDTEGTETFDPSMIQNPQIAQILQGQGG